MTLLIAATYQVEKGPTVWIFDRAVFTRKLLRTTGNISKYTKKSTSTSKVCACTAARTYIPGTRYIYYQVSSS